MAEHNGIGGFRAGSFGPSVRSGDATYAFESESVSAPVTESVLELEFIYLLDPSAGSTGSLLKGSCVLIYNGAPEVTSQVAQWMSRMQIASTKGFFISFSSSRLPGLTLTIRPVRRALSLHELRQTCYSVQLSCAH
jgi:hypothetical protein